MASTAVDIDTLSRDAEFIGRVRALAAKTAVSVGNEARTGTEFSLLRSALASNVLQDPDTWAPSIALAAACNPVITAGSSDGDIEFAISERWNAIAGAGPVPAP